MFGPNGWGVLFFDALVLFPFKISMLRCLRRLGVKLDTPLQSLPTTFPAAQSDIDPAILNDDCEKVEDEQLESTKKLTTIFSLSLGICGYLASVFVLIVAILATAASPVILLQRLIGFGLGGHISLDRLIVLKPISKASVPDLDRITSLLAGVIGFVYGIYEIKMFWSVLSISISVWSG